MRRLNLLILAGTVGLMGLAVLAARALADAEIDRAFPANHYITSYDRTLGLIAAALLVGFILYYIVRRISPTLGQKGAYAMLAFLAAQCTALWFDYRFALDDLPRRHLLPEEPMFTLANAVTIGTGAVSLLAGLAMVILLFLARALSLRGTRPPY